MRPAECSLARVEVAEDIALAIVMLIPGLIHG